MLDRTRLFLYYVRIPKPKGDGMTFQNHPEIPQDEPRPKHPPYTFNDLVTYLFRITEEFRMNGVGFDRAMNESRLGPGNKWSIRLAYEKPTIRISMFVDKERLIVHLVPRSAKGADLGDIAIACIAGVSEWTSRAEIFTSEPKRRKEFWKTVQRFSLFNVDIMETNGRDSFNISEQQAMAAITTVIEVFKGAKREKPS